MIGFRARFARSLEGRLTIRRRSTAEVGSPAGAGDRNRRGSSRLAREILSILAIVGICIFSTPAYAEDAEPCPVGAVCVAAADYPKLIGAYIQHEPLLQANKTLEEQNAALTEEVVRRRKINALDDAIIAKGEKLLQLAEKDAASAEARGDRIASEKRKAGIWSNVREKAAIGALVGSINPFPVPGVGNIGGAFLGGAAGAVYGFIEGWVQGP